MVDFDNIFNKSKSSWAFGSYEVLPIFAKGMSKYCMFMSSFCVQSRQ